MSRSPAATDSRPSASQRLYELDVLRGIAALAVIVCHYTSEFNVLGYIPAEQVFERGSYGPHLFFIISGFVILMTLQRCKRPVDFVFSRVARLYPVYWFGVLFSTSILIAWAPPTEVPTATQFIGNLTMLQTWLKIPDIETCYWTLGVELKFYALGFALLAMGQMQRTDLFVTLWLIVVAAYRLVDASVGLPHVIGTPLIVDFAQLFAAGMMFYRLFTAGHSTLRHLVIFAAIPLQYGAEGLESTIVVSAFIAVFYLFVYGHLAWTVWSPLLFLGNISYPLYLVHGTFGYFIIHTLADFNAPLWLLMVVPTIASFGVATAVHFYLEKPSGRALRNWWKQRNAPDGQRVNRRHQQPS